MKTTFIHLAAVLAIGCGTALAGETETGRLWAVHMDRPGLPNLARVSDTLYRGAQPKAEGFKELQKLGVRTVVNFRRYHSDTDEIAGFDLNYIEIPMTAATPTTEDVVQFLTIALNTNRWPIFMHCQHGADRTGLQCAAYRVVVQGWSKDDAIDEMTHGAYGFHAIYQNIVWFMRNLDVEDVRHRIGLTPAAATAPRLRLLCLGDSYTIGESVTEEERWPNQLAELLRQDGLAVEPPQIIAATGWTTMDLHRAMSRTIVEPPYDFVTLLIGVNDQFQGLGASEYLDRFQKLLGDAFGLAGEDPERLIVLSIPDYSLTPFAANMDPERIHKELEHFNYLNREATGAIGAHYVDISVSGREAAENTDLLAKDGLHPSGRMYEEWARLVRDVIATQRGKK
ncbi:MAG TPA: GDSL-type esterase/lipase family protein [Kiritimatiellia bacterium]